MNIKEKIELLLKFATIGIDGQAWGNIVKITSGMSLDELNDLDEEVVLKSTDFDGPQSKNWLVAMIAVANERKASLLIEEIYKKQIDFYGKKLDELLSKYFFREWTLSLAAFAFQERAEEIRNNPKFSEQTRADLFTVAKILRMKISEKDFRSSE